MWSGPSDERTTVVAIPPRAGFHTRPGDSHSDPFLTEMVAVGLSRRRLTTCNPSPPMEGVENPGRGVKKLASRANSTGRASGSGSRTPASAATDVTDDARPSEWRVLPLAVLSDPAWGLRGRVGEGKVRRCMWLEAWRLSCCFSSLR